MPKHSHIMQDKLMTSYQITKLSAILDFLSFHKHDVETTRNDSELLKIKDEDNEII